MTKVIRKLLFPKYRTNCDIKKYLKRAILHSHSDDAARKNTSCKEIEDKKSNYPLVIRANNNTMKRSNALMRINFTKFNNIESLLRFSSSHILEPQHGMNRTYR